MINFQNLSIHYRQKPVFNGLNFTLVPGSWTVLLGPSGIGKSSLLRLIAGLLDKQHYSYTQGEDSTPYIAYMGQTDLLLPWLTIRDNVLLSLALKKSSRTERMRIRQQAESLLEKTGIKSAAQLYPNQLSGGMRQRAALVRTLLQDKPIILMDEPFSALDAITRYKLQNLAAELLREKTVFFITHDPLEALRLANYIYIMQGNPANIHLTTTLTTPIPREPTDPNVLKWQTVLLQQLTLGELC